MRLTLLQRLLSEYTSLTERAKGKVIKKGEKFFYVILMGTRTDSRKQGLCSGLIRHLQAIAKKENFPIWLEATTAYSRDVYASLGFTMVEEILLGKGKVGSDGLEKQDGEGVKVWGMVWTPRSDGKDLMNQLKGEQTIVVNSSNEVSQQG